MTRLLIALGAIAAAYRLGRAVGLWERACETPDDEMDAVQPADPWPPAYAMRSDNTDPTYLEAQALAAIRRSAQPSDRSLGGT